MTAAAKISSYRAFWPYYLREHARPQTRAVHYLGTAMATAFLLAFVLTGDGRFGLVALLAGYGPAWFGHFFLEKNRPATFSYPFWSLISDYRMAWLWLTGHLGRELRDAGLGSN